MFVWERQLGVFPVEDNNYGVSTKCFNPVSYVLATSGLEILHIMCPPSCVCNWCFVHEPFVK